MPEIMPENEAYEMAKRRRIWLTARRAWSSSREIFEEELEGDATFLVLG